MERTIEESLALLKKYKVDAVILDFKLYHFFTHEQMEELIKLFEEESKKLTKLSEDDAPELMSEQMRFRGEINKMENEFIASFFP